MKRIAALLTTCLIGLTPALVATPAHAAGPYCGITWGSLPKAQGDAFSTGDFENIRAGQHACFDRLVLDISGSRAGHFVGYVSQVQRGGSGDVVPVRGGARLQIVALAGPRGSDDIFLPNGELIDTAGYRTFRHVAYAGDHEGETTIGLGVRARLPFRVLTLDGPGTGSRLVVDVAHRW